MSKSVVVNVGFGLAFIVVGVWGLVYVFPSVIALLFISPVSISSIVLGALILRDARRHRAMRSAAEPSQSKPPGEA